MTRNYKLSALPIVFYTVILFTVSSYAGINNKLEVDLPVQNNRLIKTQSKSDIKMSDSIIGVWSGEHISVEVTTDGADIEFDCASGVIDKKIVPDKKHRFDVSGTYVEEHGGPVRLNEQPNNYAVKYSGQIKGKKMTLTIKRLDNNKVIGTFTLFRGREPNLVKCR